MILLILVIKKLYPNYIFNSYLPILMLNAIKASFFKPNVDSEFIQLLSIIQP